MILHYYSTFMVVLHPFWSMKDLAIVHDNGKKKQPAHHSHFSFCVLRGGKRKPFGLGTTWKWVKWGHFWVSTSCHFWVNNPLNWTLLCSFSSEERQLWFLTYMDYSNYRRIEIHTPVNPGGHWHLVWKAAGGSKTTRGRGYVAEQPPMRCSDAASKESRPTHREANQQRASHTLQRLPVGTVTQVHKKRWWNMQTFDDLLKFIFSASKWPEADNRLPVWTPQRGQSETTEETAMPTHSKNSIQNQ